jgi:hypothetical protein
LRRPSKYSRLAFTFFFIILSKGVDGKACSRDDALGNLGSTFTAIDSLTLSAGRLWLRWGRGAEETLDSTCFSVSAGKSESVVWVVTELHGRYGFSGRSGHSLARVSSR